MSKTKKWDLTLNIKMDISPSASTHEGLEIRTLSFAIRHGVFANVTKGAYASPPLYALRAIAAIAHTFAWSPAMADPFCIHGDHAHVDGKKREKKECKRLYGSLSKHIKLILFVYSSVREAGVVSRKFFA